MEKVQEYIDKHNVDMIEHLIRLINIPSVSDNDFEVQKGLDYVLNLAESMGIKATKVLDGQVGIVEIGQGSETLGILTHVDVVPGGNLDAWNTNPFDAVIKDGAIYGRGAIDDKGATVACLYAMKAVESSGVVLNKKVQLILGTQEETTWVDMEAYTREFSLPDYGFTPDGIFPICNIEKGCVNVKLWTSLDETKTETKPYIVSIDGGIAPNTIPGSCRAIIRNKEGEEVLTTFGKEAHSCQPENGVNAILKMCELLASLDVENNNLYRFCSTIVKCFSDIDCSGIGLKTVDEFLDGEYLHRNVIAPTMIATRGNRIELMLNLRIIYGTTYDDIFEAFDKVAREFDCSMELSDFLPAIYISKEKPFLKAFSNAYSQVSGLQAGFALEHGGTYAKAMPNIVSWGPIFPGEVDTSHGPNEHIKLESLFMNARIFAEAIRSIAVSEESFK